MLHTHQSTAILKKKEVTEDEMRLDEEKKKKEEIKKLEEFIKTRRNEVAKRGAVSCCVGSFSLILFRHVLNRRINKINDT